MSLGLRGDVKGARWDHHHQRRECLRGLELERCQGEGRSRPTRWWPLR